MKETNLKTRVVFGIIMSCVKWHLYVGPTDLKIWPREISLHFWHLDVSARSRLWNVVAEYFKTFGLKF